MYLPNPSIKLSGVYPMSVLIIATKGAKEAVSPLAIFSEAVSQVGGSRDGGETRFYMLFMLWAIFSEAVFQVRGKERRW